MTGGALVAQLDVWEWLGGRILRPEAALPSEEPCTDKSSRVIVFSPFPDCRLAACH